MVEIYIYRQKLQVLPDFEPVVETNINQFTPFPNLSEQLVIDYKLSVDSNEDSSYPEWKPFSISAEQ